MRQISTPVFHPTGTNPIPIDKLEVYKREVLSPQAIVEVIAASVMYRTLFLKMRIKAPVSDLSSMFVPL